jgi:chromosome segregation ATPase
MHPQVSHNPGAVTHPPLTIIESKNKKKKKPKKKPNNGSITAPVEDATSTSATSESRNVEISHVEASDESGPEDESDVKLPPASTTVYVDEEKVGRLSNGTITYSPLEDATARFDALVKDRDNLKAEVTQLRQDLEALQGKHESEVESMQAQLEETQSEKEGAEEQYQNLLGKVNTIRSQLAERMKSDAVRIEQQPLLVWY